MKKELESVTQIKKGTDEVISNGSIINVNDGQGMIIVENGRVVEVCVDPR